MVYLDIPSIFLKVVVLLKKETHKFILGEQNATLDYFLLGREKVGNSELIFVSLPEYDEPLFTLWNSHKEKGKYKRKEVEGEVVFEKALPKGAGNQKAYVMLKQTAIERLSKMEISIWAYGFMLKAVPLIEWNTGRIYRKRDDKPMTIKMLSEYMGMGVLRTKSVVAELRKSEVLFYSKKARAYFVNPDYMQKGGYSGED